MDRIEIERLLLDPAAVKRLAENAHIAKRAAAISGVSTPARAVLSAGVTPFSAKATAQDIKATDRTNIRRRGILADIGRYVPELAKESPLRALEILTEEFKNAPSEEGQYLVQDAINRLTTAGELDNATKPAVAAAVDALANVKLPQQGDVQDKDSICARFSRFSVLIRSTSPCRLHF